MDFKSLTNPVDEAYAMSNATIFITPMGGGSFDANIMQDNAVVIFTEPCSNQDGKSICSPIPNEVALWNPVTHIHKLYYRHTKANTIVNDGDKGTSVRNRAHRVN